MTAADAPDPVRPAPLAVIVYDNGALADRVLGEAAAALAARGWRLGGVVQTSHPREGRRKCDMTLTDLRSGETVLISNDLGDESEGCRLNTDACAYAGVLVERALAAGIDLLVINRFGKQEAEGRGFRGAIAEALLAGIPVALAVSRVNLPACRLFAGDDLHHLAPTTEALLAWCAAAPPRRLNVGAEVVAG